MSVWDSLGTSRAALGLAKQLAFGDAPHAWLLLGPSGSGKRPVALAMATALECPQEPGVGCGRCSTCLRILRQRHPDVHHVVPEGPLIPVDVVRDSVIPEAARSPFEAARKVFIMEEADRMNQAAQNALLKTLEEPQPDTVFVLVSEHEEELLETVRSRCVTVRLEPLEREQVAAILSAEGAARNDAELAARISQGDLEKARGLVFDDDARRRHDLWMALPRRLTSPVDALDAAAEVLGETALAVRSLESAQKAEAAELAEAMGEGRGTAAARQAVARRHKRELRRLEQTVVADAFESLASFYRDVLAVRRGAASAVVNADLAEELRTWAASKTSDASILAAVQRCVDAVASLPLNANLTLVAESALVEVGRLVPPPSRVHA